jgi:hypothetical protein
MNGKVIVALVVGVCLGFAAALLVRQPQVSAADAAQKWEYKAVQVADPNGLGNIGEESLKPVNADGYEFVALSATGGKDSGCIAIFRRPKK